MGGGVNAGRTVDVKPEGSYRTGPHSRMYRTNKGNKRDIWDFDFNNIKCLWIDGYNNFVFVLLDSCRKRKLNFGINVVCWKTHNSRNTGAESGTRSVESARQGLGRPWRTAVPPQIMDLWRRMTIGVWMYCATR